MYISLYIYIPYTCIKKYTYKYIYRDIYVGGYAIIAKRTIRETNTADV